LLEGSSLKMRNHEAMGSIRPPIFNKDRLVYWKTRTRAYLQSLGAVVLSIVERGYQYAITTPTDPAENKSYEANSKAINALFGSLSESEFIKIMHFNTTKEIWDRSIQRYEGDSQVKCAKLETIRI